MDLLSLAVGFVVGAFTGAVGHYMGAKYTDKRRSKERAAEEDREWADLLKRFPKVIAEMQRDARNPEFTSVREFFVKSSRTTVNRAEPYFEYHSDVHTDLGAAISHLEHIGYIEDVTPGNCPMYRMSEQFIDKLRNS